MFVEGNMNGVKYVDILKTNILLFVRQTCRDNVVYMNDNSCPQCARLVQGFLDVEQVEHMEWPAKGPVLNPIEHLWDALGHKLREVNPRPGNLQHLWNALVNCWDAIEGHTLETLVDSVPRLVEAVMHA